VRADIYRAVIYAGIISSVTYLASRGVIDGQAAVGLLSAIAGYVVGRVVNGTSSPL
jgi:hypothetical protein